MAIQMASVCQQQISESMFALLLQSSSRQAQLTIMEAMPPADGGNS